MLTPRLKAIKERIEKKASYLRSTDEDALLKELELIEKNLSGDVRFTESITKIVSGPGDKCPCCGR